MQMPVDIFTEVGLTTIVYFCRMSAHAMTAYTDLPISAAARHPPSCQNNQATSGNTDEQAMPKYLDALYEAA